MVLDFLYRYFPKNEAKRVFRILTQILTEDMGAFSEQIIPLPMFLISQIRIFRRSEGFRLELSYYYTFHTSQRASFKIHSSWCNFPLVRVARWQTNFWRLFEFLIIIEFGTRMTYMFLKILNDVIFLLFQFPTSNTLFNVLLYVKEFLITLYKIIHSIFGRD